MIDIDYANHPIRHWIISQNIKHPWRTIFISSLLTIVMGIGIQFFVIDDDMMKMLPRDMESRASWDSVQDEFGSTEEIFIVVGKKNNSIFTPEGFATVWDLTDSLKVLETVQEVTSIATATRIDNYDGFMEVGDLLLDRDLSNEEINDIYQYLDKNPTIKKQFVSENDDYFIILAQPYTSTGLDIFQAEVVSLVNAMMINYEVHYGGNAYVTGAMPEMIRVDVQSLMKAGLIIMMIILLVNLRSIKGVLLVLMVIGLSLIAMMGFMGWVFYFTGSEKYLFTLANTSMPIILLTIANSDGVHFITKFFRDLRKVGNVEKAVASTMDSLLIPIFLTSITTGAAFLTMISSPLEPLIGYGIIIALGIIWAWLLSSTLLPSVTSLLKWDMSSKAISTESFFERLIDKFGRLVLKHPKYILLSGTIFVIIGLFGLFKITVDVNMINFFEPGTEIRDSMDFMDEELNGVMDIRVRIEGDLKDPSTLQSMISLQNQMENNDKVNLSYSIGDVVEQMHRTIMDDDPKFKTIPNERDKVNNLFSMYAMSGDPDDFSGLVDYDYKIGLITALSQVMSTDEIFSYVNNLNLYIDETFQNNAKLSVTGMIVVFRDLVILIVESAVLSISFSLIIIGIIVSLFFKRILWGFLSVVPLFAAVIMNFGFMGYFGIELSHVTAILSSIIIGVGVDFAIHYISQFRRLSRTVKNDKLSREVLDDVGYPIILDAASNMGFGALLFSAFLPIQYIGGLMVFAMISTSLGTLTLLTASAELLKKRLIER
tara:strand:+ start:1673 stop:3979 length:2307 start_codon:yes stop_codon:yes gene_type:complete